MNLTAISILAVVAFGVTKSFSGGVLLLIVLMAAFMTVATDFGLVTL